MFIVLEGGAGGGKTTQINLLSQALERKGYKVKRVSVLDDTALGRQIKQITKAVPHGEFGHLTEALLFLAAIGHAVSNLIRPALGEGFVVLANRYIFSTLAYQGFGEQFDIGWLTELANRVVGNLRPDLTIYLDVPVKKGLERHVETGDFHFTQVEFRKRVREGYLKMAAGSENWLVVDARQNATDAHGVILEKVLERLC